MGCLPLYQTAFISLLFQQRFLNMCISLVVRCMTRDREVTGSNPAQCNFLHFAIIIIFFIKVHLAKIKSIQSSLSQILESAFHCLLKRSLMICETLDHDMREKMQSSSLHNESYLLVNLTISKILRVRKSTFCIAVYSVLSRHQ